MKNAVNWFEIPVADLDRAVRFYEQILDLRLKREIFGGAPMAIFLGSAEGAGGALIADPQRKPSADGTIIYLNAGQQLDAVVGRVVRAGGAIVTGKVDIGDPGWIAVLKDTEGNVVGLHQARQPAQS